MPPWGNFQFYYVLQKGTRFIGYSLIISIREYEFELDEDMADIRVMLKEYSDKEMDFKFIIATNQNVEEKKKQAIAFFSKALKLEKLNSKTFNFEIWDESEILNQEKKLGLK